MTKDAALDDDGLTSLHHEIEVMGTIVTIDLFGVTERKSEVVVGRVDLAEASLHEADRVFSTWKSDSPMSRLRRGEISMQETPPELHEVLDACFTAKKISSGWFDPWAMPGGVDPTGYVKGWAAQRALRDLECEEISGAMVNAAGDIASFGGPGAGARFRVGVTDPFSRGDLAFVVRLDGAIATSGTYERGPHLIDPFMAEAITRGASASVTGPDLGIADALATALIVAGDELIDVIEVIEGYEALLIRWDGTNRRTTDFALDSEVTVAGPSSP